MPTSNLSAEVRNLRDQGLTDSLINEELMKRGYSEEMISGAMSGLDESSRDDLAVPSPEGAMAMPEMDYSGHSSRSAMMPNGDGNIYERIEEMAESLIDEKWDELIAEVKKIVDWKEKIEEKQLMMANDLRKLKEDFAILHQGVLGKLSDYDSKMKEVGTELQAVGKVFKDVIPEFVENVKELKHITEKRRK
ncbi:MAG TPA: hypothetical protein VJH68_00390 [Candidatus Nanoarchaeia archaeon]|nr:hypothetical protein [Candidatus Nanoarchaeia archaeon]